MDPVDYPPDSTGCLINEAAEYRVPPGWEVFALSDGLAVLTALLTVSYQSVRAAIANPAESLKRGRDNTNNWYAVNYLISSP